MAAATKRLVASLALTDHSASVAVFWAMLVPTSVMVIFALGTRAPDGSAIVPRISAW